MGRKGSVRQSHVNEGEQSASSDSEDDLDLSDEEGAINVDGIYIPPAPVPYCSIENKGPRLVIQKIVNHFFKSYAENVVLGPFHKAFNSIIGPNGSGKSNVIDSMLFVFGFRANRMRSKKLSVLIHNSPKFRNVQSATVSVYFSKIVDISDDKFDTVPNSSFFVSRTVNKDNSSFYTINDKRVQFKEVATLLKQDGIDLKHNRFLILQGEVEQIAMMPAKAGVGQETGMLEYLEDIIGTTRYKEPLLKLHDRVEDYWEKRTEKANRLKIVQDEVEVLREPFEEAVQFLKLENDIAKEKNIIYQHNIYAIKENIKEVVEEKEELDKEIGALVTKMNQVGEQKKKKETKLHEITKTYDLMEKRKENLQEGHDNANREHAKLQMQMQQINENRHKNIKQLEVEKKKVEDFKVKAEDCVSKIEQCEKQIEKLAPKAEEIQQEKMHVLATMKDATKDLQSEKDTMVVELKVFKEAVTQTKDAYSVKESELKMMTNNSDKAKQKLQGLEMTHEEIKTKLEQLTGETQKLKRVIPEKEQQIKQANTELPRIKQKEEELMHKLRSTRSKIEESKSSMQASRSKNRVLDALMQQKLEGQIPGYYGRLGDLGGIDAKYDVAISTACGPLDNIVVDTVETGQWCIEFLKRHDIGRATIIVLNLQQHLTEKCNTPIRTPENSHRLFDLINIPDEKFRPAFYYALRDTLVANDLDQASRIAYGAQRFRVVTLKGELIETTGAMSGGGKRVMRGRMGQSVQVEINPQELLAIEQQMNQEEMVLRECREKHTAYDNVIATVQPELKQMKIALEKMMIDLNGLKQREPIVAAEIKEQRGNLKRVSIDVGKVKKMENEVAVLKAAFDEATEKANVVQEKVDAITNEIKEKSQGKVKALDIKLRECNKNIEKLKTEVTRLKVGMKTFEKNAVKSENLIVSLQEEIEANQQSLIQIRDQRVEIEKDAEQFVKMIEELAVNIKNGTEVFQDLKADIKELDKCEKQFKSDKIELDQKLKELKEQTNEAEHKICGLRMKLSNLKLQDIPNAEMEPMKEYTNEELDEFDMEKVMKQLGLYEIQLRASKPNLDAINEYRKKSAVAATRSKELEEVILKWQVVRDHYDNLRTRRKDEFMTGYRIIKGKLKEMYQMITIGGDADFELVDTFDPFSEGVLLRVRPPKKTWKHISNLSGGEKTLSSLSLVFALHYYKPSPLYVLDEIDAALDFKNVSIISNYIKERTTNAQFIIISLRHEMFELSCHLIAIYKPDNTTHSGTIDPRHFLGPQPAAPKSRKRPMIEDPESIVNKNLNKENEKSLANEQDDNNDNVTDMEVDTISTIASNILSNDSGTVILLGNESVSKRVSMAELPQSQDLFSSQSPDLSGIIPSTQEQGQETEEMEVDG